jgi:hypothetical protein
MKPITLDAAAEDWTSCTSLTESSRAGWEPGAEPKALSAQWPHTSARMSSVASASLSQTSRFRSPLGRAPRQKSQEGARGDPDTGALILDSAGGERAAEAALSDLSAKPISLIRIDRAESDRYGPVNTKVMPFVVSTIEMSVNWTVIGGSQLGWNVAVNVAGLSAVPNSALPFCTGTLRPVETDALLTAFGWFPPLLMHRAVALIVTLICASPPSPASLQPVMVRVFPDCVTVHVPTWCGLPANATVEIAAIAPTSAARATKRFFRRIRLRLLSSLGSPFLVNVVDRTIQRQRAPINSGAKHHLPLVVFEGLRECEVVLPPRPTRNRGVGLLLLGAGAAEIRGSAKFRPFDGGRTDGAAVCGLSPHMRPNCKHGLCKKEPKRTQRALFPDD